MSISMKTLSLIICSVFTLSWGTDRVVSSSGPYTNIQDAIDAAAEGDRVLI
jgi:hypothetical protein